jgi:hypothetical protein
MNGILSKGSIPMQVNNEVDPLWHQGLRLWIEVLPIPTDNHVIRVFARNAEGKVMGDFARTPEEMGRFAAFAEKNNYNVYVCPNPTTRTDGIRHNAEDVSHWSFLMFDLDPIESVADPVLALDEVLAHFGGLCGHDLFKNPPTIIDSGRGRQAWLRGEDIDLTTFDRKQVRKILSFWLNRISNRLGMIHGCKLDTSVSDLPRPMRMPGTVNIKTGRRAEFITIQERPYPWLFPFLIAGTPKDVLEEREFIVTPGASWQQVFTRLTLTAQTYLTRGWREPGRHKTAFHTAKSLCELGISKENSRKALQWANKLGGKEQELSYSEIDHCLDTAYEQK